MRRAVWILGACQCVFWGLLYYGFPVLLVPMASSLELSRQTVAGAFSLCLLVMALAAPWIGRCIDRGWAANVFRGGTVAAVTGVLICAQAQTGVGLYVAWCLLGLALAAILYEPAFGLVIRAVVDDEERLRALAAVTVIGGLASTIFVPVMAMAVGGWGWRGAEVAVAVAVLATALAMERFVLVALQPSRRPGHATLRAAQGRRAAQAGFVTVTVLFSTGTFASMALTTLLIPLLLERGHSPAVAASALAMFGVMQLPGRLWVLRHGGRSIRTLSVLPVLLQALGLGLVAMPSSLVTAVLGVLMFGTGAGLHAVARPWVMQRMYGTEDAGWWNGRIAGIQGFARAAAPIVAALLASTVGTSVVFAGMGVALAALVPLSLSLLASRGSGAVEPASSR